MDGVKHLCDLCGSALRCDYRTGVVYCQHCDTPCLVGSGCGACRSMLDMSLQAKIEFNDRRET